MKKIFVLGVLCCAVIQLFAQSDKQYKKIINYSFDSTVTYVRGTPGYLLLKNAKGRYILQAYNYSTEKVYKHITFKDEGMTVMHGPMFWLDDQGNLYQKGIHVNGFRAGIWREKDFRGGYTEGPYVNNEKDGPWAIFDTSNIKIREDFYDRDTLKKVVFFNPDGTERDPVFGGQEDKPQTMPSFVCEKAYKSYENCSDVSLQVFLREKIVYPITARETVIQGDALFSFGIEKDGTIISIEAINGVCKEIEKEGKRVIKSMPKWTPGSVGDLPVKVFFTLPIRFRLE